MIILENTCAEITSGWYIDSVVKDEKTIWVYRSSAICGDIFCNNWVTRKSQKDVSVQGVQINNCSYMEGGKEEDSSLYRNHKLFLSEDWFEVVRADYGIAHIPPFRIDIPLSSESIGFGVKTIRTESDDKIELKEIFRPPHLPLG